MSGSQTIPGKIADAIPNNLALDLRIGKTKILKNPVPESKPTPFEFYCYALTNKRHSRTRSVRIYVPLKNIERYAEAIGITIEIHLISVRMV